MTQEELVTKSTRTGKAVALTAAVIDGCGVVVNIVGNGRRGFNTTITPEDAREFARMLVEAAEVAAGCAAEEAAEQTRNHD